ncbi:MAG: hypothetical protein J5738_01870 [Lachnospiraceae bacterium]|nr:hypothetical protein [Lachnospiraceae bacterium]
MKDNTEAIRKEIKGKAIALVVTFALVDVILVVMLAAMWDKQSARTALIILTGLFTTLLIVSILAVCNPLKFKWMFRNLKAEQKAQPKPRAKKAEYSHDKDFGFVSKVFNRPVSVSALNVSEGYVKKCIDFFQNMSEAQFDRLTDDVKAYYQEIKECSGDAGGRMPEAINGREILDWVYPKVMWIGNDEGREGPVEFIVECDCEWEPEHGLEIVVSDREIIHVGSYDGDLDYWKEAYSSKVKNR